MRLVFICSGLEPGRDGVGDYARELARACTAVGHDARLVSVRDTGGGDNSSSSKNELRLVDIFRRPDDARKLVAWLRDFEPDWASAQFTPFGFHPRGLGGRRATMLRGLLPPATRRHIMLHEIWLQPGAGGALRHRALGWTQRRSVDAWTGRGWQPAVIHTQARLHQARLQARGVEAKLLPLCSNFAAFELSLGHARSEVVDWLQQAGHKIDSQGYWLGHFGAMHAHSWDFTAFARKISSMPMPDGKRPCFLALGRSAAVKEAFAQTARTVPDADFCVVGELPKSRVAVMLSACDAAFTGTPWDIVEKSAAVAAWRNQGIPVLVVRAGATDPAKSPPWPDPGLILAEGTIATNFTLPTGRVPGPTFLNSAETARELIVALDSSASA
ncbi:MAG TPA: hypothetical protein VK737_00080 [Opitutales bacterium]|jgi:hypothetical protein|nr:hypothetical protein [Opitutales bacterium]